MKRIWAPWRMRYIRGTKQKGCIFCFDPALDEERLVLRREPKAMVMLNKFPYTNGHVMVIPKAHVSRPQDLDPDDFLALTRLLQQSIHAIEEILKPNGINVGMNLGAVAGAGVEDHIHFHIVPRWNGDHNFMPVVSEVRVINECLEDTAKHLKPAFDW
jgi:ATP adenylyltransferase